MLAAGVVEESDDVLLSRAARGDGIAFARLVERHRSRLMAVSTRVSGNRAIAEEIVQETFTRAWVNAPQWKPGAREHGTVAAWLSRVAVNLSIDQSRKAKVLPLEAAADPEDPAPSADAKLIEEERSAKLQAAIGELPPRQRAALALTYDQGLSNSDGAAAMNISVGAFELLLVRGRRALRIAMLEGDGT